MNKLSKYALAFVIALGANGLLAYSSFKVTPEATQAERLATDGAFRDGLYLGMLAARNAEPLRPAVGRWSTERDRSTFIAGYTRGYQEVFSGIAQ